MTKWERSGLLSNGSVFNASSFCGAGMDQTANDRRHSQARPPTWAEARAAYVQNGYQRFEGRFAKFDAAKGLALSWSWGAFIFNVFWFLYRKMYLEAAVVFGVHLLLRQGAVHFLGENVQLVGNVFLVVVILQGFLGNWLYWLAVDRKVAWAWNAFSTDPAQAMRWLKSKGGTNYWVIPLTLALLLYTLHAGGLQGG